jgi:5S rRNA maturation endonuclease (ribonuclease M5)
MSAYDRFIAAIENVTGYPGRNGTWRCPAHPDNTPSLSVSNMDQKVVAHCFAGCTIEAVCNAIDWKVSDLFDTDSNNGHRHTSQSQIVATYTYTDANGNLLFQVRKTEDKTFPQRQPDGHGGWINNTRGVPKVLYRLPQVLAAVADHRTIHIVEGEKDADAIVRAGETGTTNPSGAGNWLQEHTDTLTGATEIVIISDKDKPGYAHAAKVYDSLNGKVEKLLLARARHGKDAADHLAAGHTLDQLEIITRSQLDDSGDGDGDDVTDDDDESAPTSWAPVDLTDALAGRDLPAPELLCRTDGRHLLYRGRVHWFQGESEACKSWLLLLAAAQVLADGGRVLWLDFEDSDRGVVSRLLALSVPPDSIKDRFTYIRPDEPLRTRNGFTKAKLDLESVLEQPYDLAVIDGVTEALTSEGLSLLDNADIALWLRLLPKRIADRTGAATSCIDHLPKDRENQGRFAIGAQHKLAGVTGAAYRLEVRRRLRRSNLDPVEGEIIITVVKDRPGWVRSHSGENDSVGTMTVTSYPDGGVSISIAASTNSPTPDLRLCRRIVEHLTIYEGSSGRQIEAAVEGNATAIRKATQWMAEDDRGWLRVEHIGQSHRHYLTDLGRTEFGLEKP